MEGTTSFYNVLCHGGSVWIIHHEGPSGSSQNVPEYSDRERKEKKVQSIHSVMTSHMSPSPCLRVTTFEQHPEKYHIGLPNQVLGPQQHLQWLLRTKKKKSTNCHSNRQLTCQRHSKPIDYSVVGQVDQNTPEFLAMATQLLATYCVNMSASERAFCMCDADSKRVSRKAGAV